MPKNPKPDNKKHTKSPNGRLTIGFLTASGTEFFHLMWRGVADVARERNINAICFAGQYVRDPKGFKAQANILYDLVDAEQLDGLVIKDLMCTMLDSDETLQFYERYRPLPIVSIGRRSMEGIPCVQSSGYKGMRKTVAHLVEVHDCRRIAYIKGLPNYRPIEERYQAYVDVLTRYGLPFDPARVVVPRDAAEAERPDWGQMALHRLLDEQKADIDALVTNDDRFAHNLLPELQARGIRVPEDIALASFGDEEGSHCLTPSLTTVPIPLYEMGRQAAEKLVDQLEGKKVLDQAIDVPSDRLIVRQSCGCQDPKVTQIVAGPVDRTSVAKPLEVSLAEQRQSIVAEMMRAAEDSVAGLSNDWVEQLLDDFIAALTTAEGEGTSTHFLSTLSEILRQVTVAEGDIEVWQRVLSALRRQLLPYFSVDKAGIVTRDRAEDLWLQSQVMIGEVGQRAQVYRELLAERRKRILNEIGTALTTNFDTNDLGDILARELPRLDISRGYLALYEDPQPYRYPQSPPQWSRLVLTYDEENVASSSRVELGPGGHRFPSRQLAPPGILPQQEAYTLMVQALYFQDEQIGFMLLDGGQRDGDVYSTLRTQISSALQGSLLVQRVREHSAELTRQQYILDTFMENVPDCVYFKDLESRITRANRAYAAKLGLSNPTEEIGKSDFDFFPEELARDRYEEEQKIIRTGQPILNAEKSDGMGHWALTTKMPLRDENGEIIGTFGISHDITEMKQAQAALERAYVEIEQRVEERTIELQQEVLERTRAERELKRYRDHLEELVVERTWELEKAQAELVRQERLSILGQLTATVAHEIRNPLGTVRSSVFSIGDAIKRDELNRVERALKLAERNIVRCDAIIAELLDFTRNQALQKSPVQIDTWLNWLLDEMLDQRTIPESITLVRELHANAEIMIDSERFRRVIINVVNNAIDAMREKGPFEETRLTVSTQVADDRLEIKISDTGCGIPNAILDRIFEPLFSTKSFGIGLGLPIVKSIMEQHDGDTEINSQRDVGTTVMLWLSLSNDEDRRKNRIDEKDSRGRHR